MEGKSVMPMSVPIAIHVYLALPTCWPSLDKDIAVANESLKIWYSEATQWMSTMYG